MLVIAPILIPFLTAIVCVLAWNNRLVQRWTAVLGSSAGGHLVNMLGTSGEVKELEGDCGSPGQSSRVCCVVPFCGPANFLAPKRFEGGRSPSAVDLLLGGKIEEKPLEGWGFTFYRVEKFGPAGSTLIGVPPGTPMVEKFVSMPSKKIGYNSRVPLVVYVPKGGEVRYRIWKASETTEQAKKG